MNKKSKRSKTEQFLQNWSQYKNNPHIERNNVTKEFRCTACKMNLGDNAGGAGGHSKGSHHLRLNGDSLNPKMPVVIERKTNSVIRRKKIHFEPFSQMHDIPGSNLDEPSRLHDSSANNFLNRYVTPDDKFTRYERLHERYVQAAMDGAPEPLLAMYRQQLGLNDPLPKKDKELESLKELLPYAYLNATQSEKGYRFLVSLQFLIELRKDELKKSNDVYQL